MPIKFDFNYPPPGQDLISLQEKYGRNFLQFLGFSDYNVIKYQGMLQLPIHEIEDERVIFVDDIVRQIDPSVKKMRLTALVKMADAAIRPRNVPQGTDYSYGRDKEVIDLPLLEIGDKRVILVDEIATLADPSAKRIKLIATKRVVQSRDRHLRFPYLVLEEALDEDSEDSTEVISKLKDEEATSKFDNVD